MKYLDTFLKDKTKLLSIANRILNNKEISEDAVQEAFIRISKHDINQEGVSAFLMTTVKNISLNKKRTGNSGYLSKAFMPIEKTAEIPVEINTELFDLVPKLYDAIAQLPKKQKELIVAAMCGKNAYEYAREKGLNKFTAHTHYKLGVKRLRQILGVKPVPNMQEGIA